MPHTDRLREDQGTTGGEERLEVGAVEHYSCELVGLVVAAAVGAAAYPILVAATRPLGVLSSTGILFVLVVLWLASWGALELAWAWRAGRLDGA